jgi:DNA-binding NarL/FixJ family response regulator
MVRVAIVDSSPIFVLGLVQLLETEGCEIVGIWPFLEEMPTRDLDVIIVEKGQFQDEVSGAGPAMIVVTDDPLCGGSAPESPYAVVARTAGADEVVRAVHAGAETAGRALDRETDGGDLSPRELQVLVKIANGHTHGQVARALGISQHTVDTYVKRIKHKLGAGNKADLTRAAMSRIGVRSLQAIA